MKIAIYHPKGGSGRSTITLAIADCLKYEYKKSVQIVETDVQRTILNSVEVGFQRRHIPVSSLKANAPYIIYDGAPYTKERTTEWLKKMDKVIIPVVVSPNDATSLSQTLAEIPKEIEGKTYLVYNRVIKPYRTSYKTMLPLIESILNQTSIKKLKIELSQLEAFSLIGGSKDTTLVKSNGSGKKALEQIKKLIEETSIV